jgi:hypothetical protein
MAVQGPIGFRTVMWDETNQTFRSPVKTQFKWGKRNFEEATKCERNEETHVCEPFEGEEEVEKYVMAWHKLGFQVSFLNDVPTLSNASLLFQYIDTKTYIASKPTLEAIYPYTPPEKDLLYRESIPAFNCKCGLFCTLDIEEAGGYAGMHQGVLLLCEGGGKIILHDRGFRAKELTYLAIIRRSTARTNDESLTTFYSPEMVEAIASSYFNVPIINKGVAYLAVQEQWKTFDMEMKDDIQQMINLAAM